MNWSLKQRILRHVRIHGGDSNALARAMHCGVQKDTLMTNEKGLFAQAGLRNVRGSTIERKIMSTKTTTKRISLVAALALGFGVVTGVAANASPGVTAVSTFVGASTTTSTTVSTAVGTAVSVPFYSTTTGTPATLDIETYTPTLTTGPNSPAGATATSATAATMVSNNFAWRFSSINRMIFSITITAASTISPKSTAPREIKFAGIPT